MKNEKHLVKWIGVFVAILVVLSATPMIVNADPPTVSVHTIRWTDNDELVSANETWLETDRDDFVDDIEEAWNYSSNQTEVAEQLLLVYQEYEFIPEEKTLDDLLEFMEEIYEGNETLILDYHDTYGFGEQSVEEHYACGIHGRVDPNFYCVRTSPLVSLFTWIDSATGGKLCWNSWIEGLKGEEKAWQGSNYYWEAWVFIGLWIPFVHNGPNQFVRGFYGWTLYLFFDIEPPGK